MRLTVFYSWQTDLENRTNRGLIGDALDKAVSDLAREVEITRDERPENADNTEFLIDRDTSGVPGSPDIAHTIFDKISKADIFVGDVSIINHHMKPGGKPGEIKYRATPNPNVLIELGYAARHLAWDRVICVFNVAFGEITDLPFDIRNRRVVYYNQTNEPGGAADQRKHLAGQLKTAIQTIARDISGQREERFIEPFQLVLAELEHNADFTLLQQDGPAASIPFDLDELSKLIKLPLFSRLPSSLQKQLRAACAAGAAINSIITSPRPIYGGRSDDLRVVAGQKANAQKPVQDAVVELKSYLASSQR